ncbi:class I SAM-dependent methyltransferase [Actinokineospora iranica]|uniref:Methyltransferase domain-containing protein n=1 Tax=Actinokineospora iranica TaxID=1271860 RepID=A0A1G6P5J0_9PSEU|nr:class I SAM-dependent methyltransferase [Actinokineospora iranica]SDC74874.1 Methyltransferase domain-containing protein [Actinokineospora iranica]
MGIGPTIRHKLGRFEIPAAEAYRNRFINLDDLATTLASALPAKRILEIGCGDGSFGQRLCEAYPEAEYVGIDVAPDPGRLFRGDTSRATFRSIPSSELVAERPQLFDLVCIVDVVHHLPESLRVPVLNDAVALSTEDGVIAVKDWERGAGIAHAMAFAADRYVTGDKTVRFPSREELRGYLAAGLPGYDIALEARIPPRRNNVLYVMRRPGHSA